MYSCNLFFIELITSLFFVVNKCYINKSDRIQLSEIDTLSSKLEKPAEV